MVSEALKTFFCILSQCTKAIVIFVRHHDAAAAGSLSRA
jgi:hypothetical protein